MAKKKKRDFWDDVDEEVEVSAKKRDSRSGRGQNDYTDNYADDYDDDGRFHPTRCLPLKIVMRCLLFVAAVVVGLSGYICYKYVADRYDGGFTSSYFSSKGFSEQYNDAVGKVLKIVDAVEKDPALAETQEKVDSLAESVLGPGGNFSFLVQNEEKQTLYASSSDAKDRIEASNHFLRLSSMDNDFAVDVGGVPTKGLNKDSWKSSMDSLGSVYIIYTAVENNLEQGGTFYESYLEYQELTNYFKIARIAGIAGIVAFIVLLIFCVMATGMKNGTQEVKLSWFDYIYTELAAIICFAVLGGIVFGLYYMNTHEIMKDYSKYILTVGAILFYVILIRCYFSLVRRIKTGRFVADSLIYRIGHIINMGLNHLPKVLKGIIIFIFLVALNGGLILSLLYLRGFTVNDIPVVFIAAPLIFVIELIAFISCLFGGVPEAEAGADSDDDDYNDPAYEPAEEDPQAQTAINPEDWENVDFSKAVKGIGEDVIVPEERTNMKAATQENVLSPSIDKTVMLSQEETDRLKRQFEANKAEEASKQEAPKQEIPKREVPKQEVPKQEILKQEIPKQQPEAVIPEDDSLLNFIQLNKDVRKMFRIKLKNKSIGVTLRAPEKPILLDIDKSNAIKVLSILFDNVEKYAEEGSRVYIEMYVQKGKMVYMMKNTIKAELVSQVSGEMGGSLKAAKRIIQAEGGKFITTVDGNIFKAGILLKAAE